VRNGQRAQLGAALRKLPTLTNGGTGLYDTTLAAVRTLQDGYDPAAVNSVILLTDGENDDPGSLSLRELLTALERERDPARPVRVVAIGMGPEADIMALKRIAGVTGGSSYEAREPSDIASVFRDALLGR
jgi:Mg-chelatase subunit ChlD